MTRVSEDKIDDRVATIFGLIKRGFGELSALTEELIDYNAWERKGYASFWDMWEGENLGYLKLSISAQAVVVKTLDTDNVSRRQIAKRLGISQNTVREILGPDKPVTIVMPSPLVTTISTPPASEAPYVSGLFSDDPIDPLLAGGRSVPNVPSDPPQQPVAGPEPAAEPRTQSAAPSDTSKPWKPSPGKGASRATKEVDTSVVGLADRLFKQMEDLFVSVVNGSKVLTDDDVLRLPSLRTSLLYLADSVSALSVNPIENTYDPRAGVLARWHQTEVDGTRFNRINIFKPIISDPQDYSDEEIKAACIHIRDVGYTFNDGTTLNKLTEGSLRVALRNARNAKKTNGSAKLVNGIYEYPLMEADSV